MFRLILIAQIIFVANAFAALGDRTTSAPHTLRASSARFQQFEKFGVEEKETPIGKVKQYINNDGIVFAVSWRGIKKPDLSELLGVYYPEFERVDSSRPRMTTRAPVNIETSQIVVNSGGHMRDIRGSAYIKGMLPEGVDVRDLQ